MAEREFVIYRGQRMIAGWPERIAAAQRVTQLQVGERRLDRIPFGSEGTDWGADARPCPDCRVQQGELHVAGCDIEECPNCHEQLITCDCDAEDVDPAPEQ